MDGVRNVRFEKPVITWVDNFLGFNVGEIIPVGFYDRDKGVWVPVDNGVVVMLLDTDGDGVTDALDADGDGQGDDLDGDSFFLDEVSGLENAEQYPPGATFWRMALMHFSPGDFNMPAGTPRDATNPNAPGVMMADRQLAGPDDCKRSSGSFVEERSRIIHEDILIPGTDMKLYYTSNRVNGYQTMITVPASGPTVPESLKRIIVKLSIAGTVQTQELAPEPDLTTEFFWDGIDYLGQKLLTPIIAHAMVGFVYDSVYYRAGLFDQAFAQPGIEATEIPAREEIVLWKQNQIIVHPPLSKTSNDIAEGWTLSPRHHLNLQDLSILHKGDGTAATNNIRTISRIAGLGWGGYNGTDKPALEAAIKYPADVTVDREGNVYFADTWNVMIRKVDTRGIITNVAGTGAWGFDGDGGPADQAMFSKVHGIAVNSAGEIYIADTGNYRVRKIDTDGIVSTVAGTGLFGYSGDNGPATQAMLSHPEDIALDREGNLYIADTPNHRIRKADPDGIITTIAGNGSAGFSGDQGPAVNASLYSPIGIAVHDSGDIYIADKDNHRIRKIDAEGIISTFAGTGIRGYGGDGGPAEMALLFSPSDVAVGKTGSVYIADDVNSRIRQVSENGIITTVAGTGEYAYSINTAPATRTKLRHPLSVAVDDDGNLYITDTTNHLLKKVSHPSAFSRIIMEGGNVFAEDTGQGHVISNTGAHIRTIDLASGTTLYTFEYDEDGDLSAIIDGFGNRTSVLRDGDKRPTAITSPYGITTTLTIGDDNFLSDITHPDGNGFSFEYDPQGLMTAKIEPVGNRFEHDFDENGRLLFVSDEAGGLWAYARTAYENGDTRVTVTTAEGNITRYQDHTDSTGAYTSIITGPDGAETLFSRSTDGLTVDKSLPCGTQLTFQYDLDSEYGFSYVNESHETTVQGLERLLTTNSIYTDIDRDGVPDKITKTSSLNGKVFVTENDLDQSLITKTSPAGRVVNIHYDADSLLVKSWYTAGIFETSYQYDDRGKLVSTTAGNREILYSYNDRGFVESVTDAQNQTAVFTYDAVGRPTRVDRPDNTSVSFSYDDNGNLRWLSTPSNVDHEFTHNSVNLKSEYQTPLSGSYEYRYDNDRRLARVVSPSGNQLNYLYDATRLMQIQTPEGNIDFSYSCNSKIDSITDGVNSITYDYDGKLLVAETIDGALNASIAYQYNTDFKPDQMTYAGDTTHFLYDGDGLLTGANHFTIARNEENGMPESVSGGSLMLNRTFNGYGEITGETISINSQVRSEWNLMKDHNGRTTQRTEAFDQTSSTFKYTYDSMGRLLSVFENGILVEEYRYGPNGWRTFEMNTRRGIEGKSYDYSTEDHLLTAGTTTYQYDLDGFLTSKTDGSDVTLYQYSTRGELISVQSPDGILIEYIHDPLGRRILKMVNGTIIEKYLWQGLTRLLAILDGSDTIVSRFEYADGRMPLSMTRLENTYYLSYDPVGSLKLVADEAGNVIKRIDYDAFGNIISDSNPLFEIGFGFAGGLHDRDIGLVRFGYRDYDPQTGRWTAKDPIFFGGGDTDLYGYCLNDPVNGIDPLGLDSQWNLVNATGALHGSSLTQSRPLTQIELKYIVDISGLIIDIAAQKAAVDLSKKYIGLSISAVLKKTNFFLGIFDPFPPPAGSPEDMIEFSQLHNYKTEPIHQTSNEISPCN